MPKFGEKSEEKLTGCHKDLQRILRLAIRFTDFSVLCGPRDRETQDLYHSDGRSKVPWPESRHNVTEERPDSEAADIAPWPPVDESDPTDFARYYILAGVVMAIAWMLDIEIRWGGDWDRDQVLTDEHFRDLQHFELLVE